MRPTDVQKIVDFLLRQLTGSDKYLKEGVSYRYVSDYYRIKSEIPLEEDNRRGFFKHKNRSVTVRNFKIKSEDEERNIENRFSTLVHEIAHSLLRHDEESLSDSKKELEAEAVAYIVCQRLGIQTDAGVQIASHLREEADLTDRKGCPKACRRFYREDRRYFLTNSRSSS